MAWRSRTFDNRFGSVSPDAGGGLRFTEDFGGPAIACDQVALTAPSGVTPRRPAARLSAADRDARSTRYCHWHLGTWLDEVHESAAIPLAINRVFPIGRRPGGPGRGQAAQPALR